MDHFVQMYQSCICGVLMLGLSQEPSNKRVKPVAKSNSLTGVITPVKTPALKRIGQSISVTVTQTRACSCCYVSRFLQTDVPPICSLHSGPSVFAQRLDLCPQHPCVPAQRPRHFHADATASAGVTLWRVMISP